MKNNCFDEGIIQAFFDGELKADLLEQVARHISDCEPCSILMSDIEAESAAVSMAFERENFELVPTERLRTKIFTEIAELENGKASWLKKAASALGFSNGFKWNVPALAAFASLVFVAGVVGFVLMSKPEAPPAIAGIQSKPVINRTADKTAPSVVPDNPVTASQDEPVSNPIVRQAGYAPAKAVYRETVSAPVIRAEVQPLQDEQRYLQTIDTLKRSVDDRKDNMLKPSNLVSYERDMAIVDDAIKKMQKAARKNPRDEASKQLLLASYQNKIDLLSAVSEKTELIASMR